MSILEAPCLSDPRCRLRLGNVPHHEELPVVELRSQLNSKVIELTGVLFKGARAEFDEPVILPRESSDRRRLVSSYHNLPRGRIGTPEPVDRQSGIQPGEHWRIRVFACHWSRVDDLDQND